MAWLRIASRSPDFRGVARARFFHYSCALARAAGLLVKFHVQGAVSHDSYIYLQSNFCSAKHTRCSASVRPAARRSCR